MMMIEGAAAADRVRRMKISIRDEREGFASEESVVYMTIDRERTRHAE